MRSLSYLTQLKHLEVYMKTSPANSLHNEYSNHFHFALVRKHSSLLLVFLQPQAQGQQILRKSKAEHAETTRKALGRAQGQRLPSAQWRGCVGMCSLLLSEEVSLMLFINQYPMDQSHAPRADSDACNRPPMKRKQTGPALGA